MYVGLLLIRCVFVLSHEVLISSGLPFLLYHVT